MSDLDELERQFHAAGEEPEEDPRTSVLAQRLARRRGYGVAAQEPKPRRLFSSPALAVVALLSLWSLWGTLPDLRYWVSVQPPVELGHLGSYDLSQAREGAYARVQGVASPKRGTYTRWLTTHELFPLVASRILVDRAHAPDDALRGFGFPYAGAGRLVRAETDGKWSAVREQFFNAGELAHEGDVWVLQDGVVPRKGVRVPLESAAWAILAAVCIAIVLRRMIR